jgi:hypothetical protein
MDPASRHRHLRVLCTVYLTDVVTVRILISFPGRRCLMMLIGIDIHLLKPSAYFVPPGLILKTFYAVLTFFLPFFVRISQKTTRALTL